MKTERRTFKYISLYIPYTYLLLKNPGVAALKEYHELPYFYHNNNASVKRKFEK